MGKTQLAKDLGEALFGSADSVIKLDMSEYMERHSISRLIGAPPGYVGFDDGGQLVDRVRKKPYCVLILDEIEKAHPDIYNILLQILEDGVLTDSAGRTASFSNVILIMTSNVGVKGLDMKKHVGFGEGKADEKAKEMQAKLREFMSPELLGRIDEVVVFEDLSVQSLERIAAAELEKLRAKTDEIGCELTISEDCAAAAAKLASEKSGSAREIRRIVTVDIENLISDKILDGGSELSLCVKDGGFAVYEHAGMR